MKTILTLCFLLSATFSFCQCPVNIDFESGNFTNWQCYIGRTYTTGGQNVININPSPPVDNRHEIISSSSTTPLDYYGNFPRHCPYSGSNFSVKLGNENSGFEAEGLSYTFQIPASADTFSITYFYAVVFENPGHPDPEQPRFFVTAYDVVTGNLINCASYNYVSTASIPGFQQSTVDSTVLFKDWTPASIDFSGLAGRQVRLEFKTADCTQGAHFGYAYLDVGTGCGGLTTVAALCGSSNSVVLNAPFGFQNYTWYNGNYSVVVGNQQNVTISPAPPANSLFHVDMVPYPGFGCRDTADAMVTALPVPDTPTAISLHEYCQFATAQALSASPSNPNSLLWYTNATGGIGATQAPVPSTASSGIFHYYVTQKVLFGCESERKEVKVIVNPTPISSFIVNNDRQCQGQNNFIFTNTTTNTLPNAVYTWDFGDGNSSTLPNPNHSYANYGTYTVKLNVLNLPNCDNTFTKQVYVLAEPLADFSYPPMICEQQTPVLLTDNSTVPGNLGSINEWRWLIGSTVSTAQSPIAFFANGGNLPVKLIVRTIEGCLSAEKLVNLQVHYRPKANFNFNGLFCENEIINFRDQSILPGNTSSDRISSWHWQIDNIINSSIQNPEFILAPGNHQINFISETNVGCKSIQKDSTFTIYGKPKIDIAINDSCINRDIFFNAISSNSNLVTKWFWNFNNQGFLQRNQFIIRRYTTEQNNPIKLIGQTVNGCKDTLTRPFRIYENHAFAGRDTIAALSQPVQLDAGGSNMLYYSWSPSLGLNSSSIRNPIANLDRDQLYVLNSMSIYGCDARSEIFIKRYKGPELFIPSAFTPNNDGLNDVLKVIPVGIKAFYSFAVYNRFGNRLFYTNDYTRGWDGTFHGEKSAPGTYVYLIRALDYHGKEIMKKGTVVLLR